MRARPRSITILSFLFYAAPLVMLALLFAQSHFQIDQLQNAWKWNYSLLMLGSVAVGSSIWSVRPWGYISCLFLVVGGVLHSLYSYVQSPGPSGYLFLITTVVMAAVTLFLLQRHVASPYFNPKERWWETPDRYRAQFQVVGFVGGKELPIELVDISRTGCFIKNVEHLNPGDLMHIRIALLDVRLELMTKAVRKSKGSIDGIGLMFMDLTRADRKDLKLLLTHLQTQNFRLNQNLAPAPKNKIHPAA